jgi:serine protease DegQ
VTLDGQLVGINTAIIAPSGGNVGIGFAVPANMAEAVIDQLIRFGDVQRGQLGVMVQDFTPDLAQALGVETAVGAVITQVEPDSAAEAAQLQAGDLIVSVDGRPVVGAADLRSQIGLRRVGVQVDISVIRDGRTLEISATLRDASQPQTRPIARRTDQLSGAYLRDLGPDDELFGTVSGVLVVQVDSDSHAAYSGLEPGDIILAVNRVPVGSVTALRAQLASIKGALALTIQRGSARIFLLIR